MLEELSEIKLNKIQNEICLSDSILLMLHNIQLNAIVYRLIKCQGQFYQSIRYSYILFSESNIEISVVQISYVQQYRRLFAIKIKGNIESSNKKCCKKHRSIVFSSIKAISVLRLETICKKHHLNIILEFDSLRTILYMTIFALFYVTGFVAQ